MPAATFTKSYHFEAEDTCKQEWIFTISDGPEGRIIEDLEIHPHTNDEGVPRGCQGHPKTICVLLRGLPLEAVHVSALAEASCIRNLACGQALAKCIEDLRKK